MDDRQEMILDIEYILKTMTMQQLQRVYRYSTLIQNEQENG